MLTMLQPTQQSSVIATMINNGAFMFIWQYPLGNVSVNFRKNSNIKLETRQPRIKSALFAQVLGGAGFNDAPVFHHHDPVDLPHGGQSVRDDERGAPLHRGVQSLLYQDLRF